MFDSNSDYFRLPTSSTSMHDDSNVGQQFDVRFNNVPHGILPPLTMRMVTWEMFCGEGGHKQPFREVTTTDVLESTCYQWLRVDMGTLSYNRKFTDIHELAKLL